MSTSVIEALRNAQVNLKTLAKIGLAQNPIYEIAMEQLHNGIGALENGKSPDDIIQENIFSEIDIGG